MSKMWHHSMKGGKMHGKSKPITANITDICRGLDFAFWNEEMI